MSDNDRRSDRKSDRSGQPVPLGPPIPLQHVAAQPAVAPDDRGMQRALDAAVEAASRGEADVLAKAKRDDDAAAKAAELHSRAVVAEHQTAALVAEKRASDARKTVMWAGAFFIVGFFVVRGAHGLARRNRPERKDRET